MIRFSVCNELFDGWSWADTVSAAAGLGYDGLEVAPFTLGPAPTGLPASARAELRAAAEGAGLSVAGLHWLLAKTEGVHLTHPDADVRAATAAYLGDLADLCADLGGGVMVFGSPKQRSLLRGVDKADALSYAVEVLRGAAERGADRGVVICMEALPTEETDFVNTVAEARHLVGLVDHDNCKLMVDVKSMCSEGQGFGQIISMAGSDLRHVHANDANRRGPGMGDTDFRPVAEALDSVAYDGWVSVEPFDYSPDPVTVARESLTYLKSVFARREHS